MSFNVSINIFFIILLCESKDTKNIFITTYITYIPKKSLITISLFIDA
ncbi:hypothetical protein HMPREF3202_02423 [Prevotella bivia]|uniref:Uncharacterized protein n=1 Tax=Prevotella bivia TaxID=28125 RepID=A0A137SQH1_9BACT|nr:hypothetical protein HMPREF3202_02423 [Prevotella bivia]